MILFSSGWLIAAQASCMPSSKRKDKSVIYFQKAKNILFPNSHPVFQAGYYQELAEAEMVSANYEAAINSYLEAIKLYENGSTINVSRVYRLMTQAYKQIGKFEEALMYQEKYSQTLLDSFKLDKLLAVTATEHEYEQKQQQIETEMLKQKNAEINMYVKQLEQSNEDLKQFAHAASHDLREPVRAIVSYASLLEMSLREKLTAEEKEYLLYLKEGGKAYV